MIATCQHCHTAFWRYRRDHPPRGFCSIPHAALGRRPVHATPPLKPAALLEEWRLHRIEAHFDRHFLQDYDCETCEYFNDRYSESLAYWIDHPVWYAGVPNLETRGAGA